MKHKHLKLLSIGLLLSSGILMAAPSASSHLEQGVELMQDEATVKDAIPHFERVVAQQEKSDKLAAEALYLLAKCQLQLDDEKTARATVAKLIDGWPADNAWVKKATELIPSSSMFGVAPWSDSEALSFGVSITHEGEVHEAGDFLLTVAAGENKGRKTWTTWSLQFSMDPDFSMIEFLADDFRPLRGRVVTRMLGDVTLEESGDGGFLMRETDKRHPFLKGNYDPTAAPETLSYHHHQVLHLVRLLPDKIGTTVSFPTTSPKQNLAPAKQMELIATKHEEVTVPAGTFDCVLYEAGDEESFWVERSGRRRLVQVTTGPVKFMLKSSDDHWDPNAVISGDEASGNSPLGGDVPDGMIEFAKPGGLPWHADGEGQRTGLFDSKLRVWGGVIEQYSEDVPLISRADWEQLVPKDGTDKPRHMVAEPTLPAGTPKRDEDTPDSRSEPKLVILDDNPFVQDMAEHLTRFGFEATEVAGSRRLLEEGRKLGFITRFSLEHLNLKLERTVLVAFEQNKMTAIHFDHETGAGDQAVSLLEKILKDL